MLSSNAISSQQKCFLPQCDFFAAEMFFTAMQFLRSKDSVFLAKSQVFQGFSLGHLQKRVDSIAQ